MEGANLEFLEGPGTVAVLNVLEKALEVAHVVALGCLREVEEAVEVERRVLDWRACEAPVMRRLEGAGSLVFLRTPVLDGMRLVQHHPPPASRQYNKARWYLALLSLSISPSSLYDSIVGLPPLPLVSSLSLSSLSRSLSSRSLSCNGLETHQWMR